MATREIKTRLALEGEQKFKSAMKDAANSIKVLNSEQKLAKATFRQTGDAQKYTAQQADILKKKIEEQKKAVKAAEEAIKQLTDNGVKENDRAMQQWQTKLNDAKTALTNMETELQNLSSNSEQASSSTDKLGDSLEHLDKTASIEALSNAVNKMADGLGRALGQVKQMAQGLVTELQGAASWADELLTTATMWEMDPEKLQRMRKTARIIDTDVETILTAQQTFMRSVSSDSKEADEAFKSLGIHVEKYKHGVWSFEDMADPFWQAGAALMTYSNANDQARIAQQLFGRSWRELVPLFTAGRDVYEQTMAEQSVVSNENVEKLGLLDDAIQKLSGEFETFQMTLDSALAPTLTDLSNQLTGFLKEVNTYLASDDGKKALKDLQEAFHALFEDITNLKPEDVFNKLKDGLDKVTEGLKWIKNNKDDVVNGIKLIVGAWAGLKVTGGLLVMIKAINALKELAGLNAKKIAEVISAASGGDASGSGAGIPTVTKPTPAKTPITQRIATGMTNFVASGALPAAGIVAITGAMAAYTSTKAVERDYGEYNEVREAMDGTAADVEKFGQAVVDAQAAIDAWRNPDNEKGTEPIREYIAQNEEAVRTATEGADIWARVDEAAKTAGKTTQEIIQSGGITATAEEWLMALTNYIAELGTKKEEAAEAGAEIPEGTAEGIEEGTGEATSAAETMGSEVATSVEGLAGEMEEAGRVSGEAIGEGMAQGMESKIGRVQSAGGRLATAAAASIRTTAEIHSPSKVMMRLGEFIGLGFAEGIESQLATVGAAAEHMASAAMVQPAGFPGMRMTGSGFPMGGGSGGMVDVTLMLGPEKLSEVLVPLVNDSLGAEMMRR